MDTTTSKPANPISSPASLKLQSLRQNLDEHIFFWIMLVIALIIFFGVPQITNVWNQQPPWESGVLVWIGYIVFLIYLIEFYSLSMFAVIRRFPAKWVQDQVEAFVNARMTRWQDLGRRRYFTFSFWFAALTWRAPDLCSRWLVHAVSAPRGWKRARRLALAVFVAVLIGSSALVFGTHSDASRWYSLAGAFCQTMALYCLLATIWLAVAISGHADDPRQAEHPNEVLLYLGRFLAWLIATIIFGEILWRGACTNWLDNLISYRLYTIWAIFQVLTTLVIVGLLIDRWHAAVNWPIRQVAVLLLPLPVWLLSRSMPVEISELGRHLSKEQNQVWKRLCEGPNNPNTLAWHSRSDADWFAHLIDRVDAVPKSEPLVIVAASGGGSRAAIFTSLVLEALARTPIGKDARAPIANDASQGPSRTWADNIILVSSVSGGSLATAYYVERRSAHGMLGQVPVSRRSGQHELLNTSSAELRHWGTGSSHDLIQAFFEKPLEGFPGDLLQSLKIEKKNSKATIAATVAALEEAEPCLSARLKEVVKRRDQKQATLAVQDEELPENAEQIAKEILDLNETAGALRMSLALLDSYRSMQSSRDDPLSGWIWKSQPFDEMCVDFMAPLMRGVLTPALDRGDALARFWTHRYGWTDCTNFSGYHGALDQWNYTCEQPAVVFNAVDVARGSRLMIGFPPLPSNFWDEVYRRGVTREVPRALNAPVSLARAVRMSSNFPYGFRAMGLQSPAQTTDAARPFESVHVLDGGVVDNTGLDTIYELLMAVEFHADPKNKSCYQNDAATLLAQLRERGVFLLEIDAGAKPSTGLPSVINPFGGLTEQLQALNNGSYSNADRAKQLYIKEIRRVLTQQLDEPGSSLTPGRTSLRDLENSLPSTALHYCFQCNHYRPGRAADPAIMTAWALGPKDKAEVVARFLPELTLWDQRRHQLLTDMQDGKDRIATFRETARLRILLDRIIALNDVFHQLADNLEDLVKLARVGKPIPADKLSSLGTKFNKAKTQRDQLSKEVKGNNDEELSQAWAALDRQVREDESWLKELTQARNQSQIKDVISKRNSTPNIEQKTTDSYNQIRSQLRSREEDISSQIAIGTAQKALLDPQQKYDLANRQAKELEKRSEQDN